MTDILIYSLILFIDFPKRMHHFLFAFEDFIVDAVAVRSKHMTMSDER